MNYRSCLKHLFCQLPLLLLFMLMVSCDDHRFAELDSYLARRNEFVDKKRARIQRLNEKLSNTADTLEQLQLMDSLFTEQYTFRFDSTMICLDQMRALAEKSGNEYYQELVKLHSIVELSTGGFFTEANELISTIDTTHIDDRLKYKFYEAMFWATSYMVESEKGTRFRLKYKAENQYYKRRCVAITDDPRYRRYIPKAETWNVYYRALLAYDQEELSQACHLFKQCLAQCRVNERLYAMTAFSLANCYRDRGMNAEYEYFVKKAAISDVVCPLKENLALQQYALYLHEHYPDEVKRADRYIRYSLEDARFYNNRLRMAQISNILPGIIDAYQQKLSGYNSLVTVLFAIMALAAIALIVGVVYLRKSRNMVSRQREELVKNNEQIGHLNKKLSTANSLRERQIHIFLDLCVVNISQFDAYRALVQRKVKAKQAADLMSYSNTTVLSEQESADFLSRFDKSFLSLYPDFVEQVNTLLDPDNPLIQKEMGRLTPELRILALIRLGITESSAIATLLFYTPQTVYNYRSAVKRRAIDRARFEEQVTKIAGV